MPPSVQEPPRRKAWRVRWLPDADDAYSRSFAVSRTQPCGIVGSGNRTSARRFPPLLDMTLRIESEPLFADALLWSIQASASADTVCAGPQFTGVPPGWIVHCWLAGVWSTLPAASVARTLNVCCPTVRLV